MRPLRVTRTRVQDDSRYVPTRIVGHNPDGSVYADYAGETFRQFTYSSVMKDNVNKRSVSSKTKGKGYPPSDVQNTIIRIQDWSPVTRINFPNGGWADISPPHIPLSEDEVMAVVPTVPDDLANEMAIDFLTKAGTQISQDVDLPNFIFEAREIGELIPQLLEALGPFLARLINRPLPDGKWDTVSKELRHLLPGVLNGHQASQVYLNLNFGWLPLAKDLRALGSIAQSVSSKLDRLRAINGKTTRLASDRLDAVGIPAIRFWQPLTTRLDEEKRLASYRADLHVGCRLYTNLRDLDNEIAFWRALPVALGLTNPLKSLWESTPFSFFLDWFNKTLSRSLNLVVNPFQGNYDVQQLCYSIKEKAVVDFRYSYEPDYNHRKKMYSAHVQRFTRYAGLPVQASIFNIDELTSKQQTLYLALLGSTGRR